MTKAPWAYPIPTPTWSAKNVTTC
ncbi:MAG: hypothetical protein K0S79_1748, partial [Nitrospira sp.]|nr:hypothetical protein [Nitrospira sp.]